MWPLLIEAGLRGKFSLEMSQNPHDFTEPVSRTRQMHTETCWDKPRARQMLPKGQKGADVQMKAQASVISSACFETLTNVHLATASLTFGRKMQRLNR